MPSHGDGSTGGIGSTAIVPYRNKNTAAKGLLKDGKTAIAEITDGTSNTAMILECAGRDESYVSQFLDGYTPVRGQGVQAGPHRYWRWADPGNAFGTSGGPNNKGIPSHEASPWPATTVTAGNQAGANEEPYSFHKGGINVLLGDGTVRIVKVGAADEWRSATMHDGAILDIAMRADADATPPAHGPLMPGPTLTPPGGIEQHVPARRLRFVESDLANRIGHRLDYLPDSVDLKRAGRLVKIGFQIFGCLKMLTRREHGG